MPTSPAPRTPSTATGDGCRRPGYALDRRDPRPGRSRRDLRPCRRGARGGRGSARAGVRALVVISAGFAEVGQRGRERQERLLALVRAHGARLIGPNCLASRRRPSSTRRSPRAWRRREHRLLLAERRARPGAARGRGVERARPLGVRLDRQQGGRLPNDLLEWWADDAETAACLLYLESFGNPRSSPSRPAGRAAQAGARAEERHLHERAARRELAHRCAGGIRRRGRRALPPGGRDPRRDARGLVDVAALLSRQRRSGRRLVGLTNAGGLGILCADACEAAGLELRALEDATVAALRDVLPAEASVANPVDMLGGATAETYAARTPALLATDPTSTPSSFSSCPPSRATADEVAAAASRRLRRRRRSRSSRS